MGKQAVRAIEASCIVLVVSCGGGGNAALSRSFDYGAPSSPTTEEQSAISSSERGLLVGFAFLSPSAAKGEAVIDFADALSSIALGIGTVPLPGSFAPPRPGRALDSAFSDSCVTVTANSVSFANCVDVEAAVTFTLTFTLNGTVSGSPGTLDWNASTNIAGTELAASIDLTRHRSGSLAVTGTTIKGTAISDFGGPDTGAGQSGFNVATAALIDVGYQTAPAFCVTSGTVEVKRVWTKRLNGESGGEFADAGVKVTWSGCRAVQVAHSR